MDNTKISALTVAGDYLFLGYAISGRTAGQERSKFTDQRRTYVGEITPTPAVGSQSGTFDIPYAIRAFKRHDGEYLVFAEDDHYARFSSHRWKPAAPTFVDTLETLPGQTPFAARDWDIDSANGTHFSRDEARARRTTIRNSISSGRDTKPRTFPPRSTLTPKLRLMRWLASRHRQTRDLGPLASERSPAISSGGGGVVSTYRPREMFAGRDDF
jgi:hypothetical protein